jgi:hypothetical protein
MHLGHDGIFSARYFSSHGTEGEETSFNILPWGGGGIGDVCAELRKRSTECVLFAENDDAVLQYLAGNASFIIDYSKHGISRTSPTS